MPARPGSIKTKRWDDPVARDDGFRLLVTRYRPRGVARADETWDEWQADLGPSRELHAQFWGKHGPPLSWPEYKRRYLAEMRGQKAAIAALVARAAKGETLTLLCSSACLDPARCHRTLLADLIANASLTAKSERAKRAGPSTGSASSARAAHRTKRGGPAGGAKPPPRP